MPNSIELRGARFGRFAVEDLLPRLPVTDMRFSDMARMGPRGSHVPTEHGVR